MKFIITFSFPFHQKWGVHSKNVLTIDRSRHFTTFSNDVHVYQICRKNELNSFVQRNTYSFCCHVMSRFAFIWFMQANLYIIFIIYATCDVTATNKVIDMQIILFFLSFVCKQKRHKHLRT